MWEGLVYQYIFICYVGGSVICMPFLGVSLFICFQNIKMFLQSDPVNSLLENCLKKVLYVHNILRIRIFTAVLFIHTLIAYAHKHIIFF